jgi:hypothetical protein
MGAKNARNIDRKALVDWFVGELALAQQERRVRQGVTESGELEWVVFERNQLLKVINQHRTILREAPVEMEAVMRIEQSAVGHSDYTQKLAIGAAELVLAD